MDIQVYRYRGWKERSDMIVILTAYRVFATNYSHYITDDGNVDEVKNKL